MDLESWIRRHNIVTKDFIKLVGCSKFVIWKAKRGEAICPKFAAKIYELTNGEVIIKAEKVGRRPYDYSKQ